MSFNPIEPPCPISGIRKSLEHQSQSITLDTQKITFDFLKAHLWSAADMLRGSLVPAEYRQEVMTLLFLKRQNDTFEEKAEKLIKRGRIGKDIYKELIGDEPNWFILNCKRVDELYQDYD